MVSTVRSSGEVGRQELFDGGYEIAETVGRGRNSVVYKASCLSQQRSASANEFVALKVLTGNYKQPEENIQRMKREALAMLSCRHPNVTRLFDFVARANLCYLVMEYAERGDLRSIYLSQNRVIDLHTAGNLTIQLLSGLEAIHERGIIHRDIKPDNLLLTDEGIVKIADFGVASLPTERSLVEDGRRGIGTFDYLSPECLRDGDISESSDLYSVGVTFYQLLTGALPFSGATFAAQIDSKLLGARPRLSEFLADVPPYLEEFLDVALGPTPEARFPSATLFKVALTELLAGSWRADVKRGLLGAGERNIVKNGSEKSQGVVRLERRRADSVIEPVTLSGLQRAKDDHTVAVEDGEDSGPLELGQEDLPQELVRKNRLTSANDRVGSALLVVKGLLSGVQIRGIRPLSFRFKLFMVFLIAAMVSGWLFGGQVVSLSRSFSRAGDTRGATGVNPSGAQEQIRLGDSESLVEESSEQRVKLLKERGLHVGMLYALLPGDEDVSLLLDLTDGDTNSGLISLALHGWVAKRVNLKDLTSGAKILLSGEGMKIELWLEQAESDELSGRYRELVSKRQGRWTLW